MTAPSHAKVLGDSAARSARTPLCRPGETCWVRLPAQRVAFLVDADAYYAALYAALQAAQKRVWIVGWDVHARTRLRPEAADAPELGPFLDLLVRRRRGLRIHVLEWDYSVLFASERGLAPWIDLDWRTHPRVRFLLDDRHPVGACVHEKIVVIDDTLAFVGGLDLTLRRWDTSEHRGEDPRRVDPWGQPYEPFHDVQMMVEGRVARAIAERVRSRWNEVGGARVRHLPVEERRLWPRGVPVDVWRTEVAVARTEPAPSGIREIERLYLEAIRAARNSIYLENQYFSAEGIVDALCERLAEPRGPEVVVVLPMSCSGWIEEKTMGARRAGLLGRLREADRFGRFRAYAPRAPGVGRVNVHAKLMIVDDAFVRIGSANLANRSLGFDRECDLALESDGRRDVAQAIVQLRTRLVSEHLGVTPQQFSAAWRTHERSLVGAIEELRHAPRTLVPLEPDATSAGWLGSLIDPGTVSALWEPLERWTPDELRDPHRRSLLLGLVGAVAFGAVVTIGWIGLHEGLGLASETQRATPGLSGLALALAVAVGSQLFLPITALIFFGLLTLGAGWGGLWAVLGALTGAAIGWCLGRYSIGSRIERLAPTRIAAFRRRLRQRSVVDIAALRLAPALPFAIANLAAGAARVRLRAFLLATLLTLLPIWGLLAAVLGPVRAAWREPSVPSVAGAALAVAAAGAVLAGLRRWGRRGAMRA